ncbi:DUF433 domain-containing protein [Roseofilum capinflatum]|uniref:DUF433 domain-containing protein n=1 Tax=Roseofilum capinflatum BLCC-M114 TaxID=3022440 RepID=A0ABT7B250_9CYAN|nr:DUF433 domain-containing protein [Roseofilum capinflatum]MDJ1173237.1 DUF433 domain-containing protein [Roseofilum capinflatum BLCC-M114]
MTFTTDNPVTWQYLEIDAQSRAKIANSRVFVSQLIQEKHAHGWSPEELHFQHPEISLAAIYSALSYYYTYQSQIDAQIAQEQQTIQALQAELIQRGVGHYSSNFKQKLQTKRGQQG